MVFTYDGRNSDIEYSSRSSYGGRKCACCFRFGFVLLTIEMIFTLVSSFLLAKEFVMNGRHTEISGKDLRVAYIIRDEDINISFGNGSITEIIVNGTVEDETSGETGEVVSPAILLEDTVSEDIMEEYPDEYIPDDSDIVDSDTTESESADSENGVRASSPHLLSVVNEHTINFVNTTVRNFVEDIIHDIKNSSMRIVPEKKYFVQSMEFVYLTLALEVSSLIYVLVLIIFCIYFFRNYVC